MVDVVNQFAECPILEKVTEDVLSEGVTQKLRPEVKDGATHTSDREKVLGTAVGPYMQWSCGKNFVG